MRKGELEIDMRVENVRGDIGKVTYNARNSKIVAYGQGLVQPLTAFHEDLSYSISRPENDFDIRRVYKAPKNPSDQVTARGDCIWVRDFGVCDKGELPTDQQIRTEAALLTTGQAEFRGCVKGMTSLRDKMLAG